MPNKIILGANRAQLLDRSDKFWLVTNGEVNIYYVEVDDESHYVSPLNYLYTAQKGELIFSLLQDEKQADIRLLLNSSDASLVQAEKSNLLEIDHLFLTSFIDKWVIRMSKILYNTPPPRTYKSINDDLWINLSKNEFAYPQKGVLWCSTGKDTLHRFTEKTDESIPHNNQNILFPVSSHLWLKAKNDDVHISFLRTSDLIKDPATAHHSLDQVQAIFYARIIYNEERKNYAEEERITAKIERDKNILSDSLHDLSSIIKNVPSSSLSSGRTFADTSNVLLTACQRIGDKVGFEFATPKHFASYEGSTLNKQLFAIAQASNVRIRKVILRGTWWSEESGHLLAFYGDERLPVALIQRNATSYTMIDTQGTEHVVDKEIAQSLDPTAYMFFFAFDGKMNSLSKIWNYAVRGVKNDAKFLMLAALAGSLLGLLVPVLSGVMFDDVIPTADRSMLLEVFGIMLIIGIVTAMLQLIQGILQLRVETKSNINLQGGLMDHLLRLPVTFYRKYTAGDLTNRALSINAIRQILSNTIISTVLSGTFSIVNLALLFYYDKNLAWIGLVLAIIAVVFISLIGWLKLRYDRFITTQQGEIQGFLFEFLSGITKIRITGAEKRIFTLWAKRFSQLKQNSMISGTYQNYIEIFNGSYPLLTNILFFGFIYYTMVNINSATASLISVGAFMAFITAFNQFLNDSLRMSLSIISSLNVVTLYERAKPIFEELPESTNESADPGELTGDIELNSISFRYQEDQPLILSDVSFKIKQGEMVAFVGPSGSGKSTIMRLLLGFEEPLTGSVYYDGTSFDTLNKDLIRQQIGVVLQNGALMAGSIFKNIVGNSDLTIEDAWDAARMAGLEDDINSMPMGMHTVVSEGGGTFSGGQKQRLMIARAIAHKPRILYMDEATSALDNKTQKIVSDSLDRLQATRIVIAHRLSTIMNADRIFVLDKGSIVESGTYEELMEQEGLFQKLAKRQIA